MLPHRLEPHLSEEERARWSVVRLDTHAPLPGVILEADADAGKATMRERGPDEVDKDGVRTKTFRQVSYALGPGTIAIVRA